MHEIEFSPNKMRTTRLLLFLATRLQPCSSLQLSSRHHRSLTRRTCLEAACAGFALVGAARPAHAAESSKLELIKQARAQLEPCATLIDEGSWDGVRTVVKTAPLVNAKNLITQYIEEVGEQAEDLVGPREDLVQALQMLDMSVYNNNFIGEQNGQGKPGAGVKIDKATPLVNLAASKAALDEVLRFKL